MTIVPPPNASALAHLAPTCLLQDCLARAPAMLVLSARVISTILQVQVALNVLLGHLLIGILPDLARSLCANQVLPILIIKVIHPVWRAHIRISSRQAMQPRAAHAVSYAQTSVPLLVSNNDS